MVSTACILTASSPVKHCKCLLQRKCLEEYSTVLVLLLIKVHQCSLRNSRTSMVNLLILTLEFILRKWFKLVFPLSIAWLRLLEVRRFLCSLQTVCHITKSVHKSCVKHHSSRERMCSIILMITSPSFSVQWVWTWKLLDSSDKISNPMVPWRKSFFSSISLTIQLLSVLLLLVSLLLLQSNNN